MHGKIVGIKTESMTILSKTIDSACCNGMDIV